MSKQGRVVTDSMIGLKMPDYSRISPRVATVLGQNPSPFTGPGTNTYIVGTSKRPILLDTGQGVAIVRRPARSWTQGTFRRHRAGANSADSCPRRSPRRRRSRSRKIRRDGSPQDAVGGPRRPRPARFPPSPTTPIVHTEGATLRAVFTPGHAPDHLCYYLEEERALFTGDVVLGAGTTVIPDDTGDLGQYMDSLRRLLALDLETIYPAHGPVIRNPKKRLASTLRIASCASARCSKRSPTVRDRST